MTETAEAFEVRLEEAPIKKTGEIDVVERYQGFLRLESERIYTYIERRTSDNKYLQLAVFAIKCTVRLEDLCSARFVFRTIPIAARTVPAPL